MPAACLHMHQENKPFVNSKPPDWCRIVIPTHNTWPHFSPVGPHEAFQRLLQGVVCLFIAVVQLASVFFLEKLSKRQKEGVTNSGGHRASGIESVEIRATGASSYLCG